MKAKGHSKLLIHALVFVTLLLCTATTMTAAPGDLDPTFGNGGIVITQRFNGNNNGYNLYDAYAMAIQPDGKIVVVGEAFTNPSDWWDFAVVRYNPDGSLDNSFGGGIVNTRVGNSADIAHSVAIQTDGKIVVAGSTSNIQDTGYSFAVVRYNPDGSLDTSFNGTGMVSTPVGNSGSGAGDLAIQTDGKIVVAGSSGNDLAIVRYNADGSLDTTFNGSGIVLTPVGRANSVAIQANGKIIAAGGTGSSGSGFTLVRYNADGSLDTSFNGTGIVITPAGNSWGGASDLAIQTDGKIVVVGYSVDFAVVRYNPDGSLDTSFGGTGKIRIPNGVCASSVAIQPNGKIFVGGDSSNIGSDFTVEGSDFALVRLNPNGSLDTSFNGTGTVITSVGDAWDTWDTARSVAIQPDGKIVVAGDTGPDDFKRFVVVRYQGDAPSSSCSSTNPIDCADFFISQQYRDFLAREPEPSCPPGQCGLDFYLPILNGCAASDTECTRYTRGALSANFFRSPEFQAKGSYVMYLYLVAIGQRPLTVAELQDASKVERPHYAEFMADMSAISSPDDRNGPDPAKKAALTQDFVQRAEIVAKYPTSTYPTLVSFGNALAATAGVTLSSSTQNAIAAATTRAQVLQIVAESAEVNDKFYQPTFVTMEYFGYLRRDPEDCHDSTNWWGKPDASDCGFIYQNRRFNELLPLLGSDLTQNFMVRGFIEATEYHQRFGP